MSKRYRKMAKKANGKIREINDGQVILEIPLPIADVLAGIPEAVEELSQDVGLMLVSAVIESECERIAGEKNVKNPLRTANWWGSQLSPIYYAKQINNLERRGVDMNKDYLFVLDGSKALRSAVARKFVTDALVQRCQQHKRRNVRDHLPPEHQEAIDARIRAAYNMADYDKAKESLDLTVRYLERLNPSAAASLKEGLEETLTLHKLAITGLLRKTLSTTNPIESCFSVTRTVTGRVKNWNGGDMVQRWAVAALLRAEKKFKRVKGYREIPKLIAALQQKNLDRKEVAT